jgi:hypothetical protein
MTPSLVDFPANYSGRQGVRQGIARAALLSIFLAEFAAFTELTLV